jgi:uncharacterized protein (TIGR02680 family)
MTAVADHDRVTDEVLANPHRFRLRRAGVLNVWQYDDQVFDLPDGRLLLRGANGAGKSKTLEMLLPFALDGDKMRITASGRHHTSLLWLMTDGYDGNRTGYVWVEFARVTESGDREVLTCGVGIRASSTSKTATSWYFTSPRQVGLDLHLEDAAGPLSRDGCRAAVGADGHVFEQAKAYRAHVGRELFGLEPGQYDELLRLLYWLRQPQIGEDIEPAKLAEQLLQALPQVDDDALRSAGDTFDELAAFGEQLDRRARAAGAVASFAGTYADYARTVSQHRGSLLVEAHRESARRASAVAAAEAKAASLRDQTADTQGEQDEVRRQLADAQAVHRELESSPEARNHQRLLDMQRRAGELAKAADQASRVAHHALEKSAADSRRVDADAETLQRGVASHAAAGQELIAETAQAGADVGAAPPSSLDQLTLSDGGDEATFRADLAAHTAGLEALRPAIGELRAAVLVVDEARQEADRSTARRETENRRAAEAEQRAEQARGRLADTAAAVRADESAYLESLRDWQSDPAGAVLELPELTAAAVAGMPQLARAAAADQLTALEAEEAAAAAERIDAERALAGLGSRRRTIEAEPDPAPPEPALGRSARNSTTGAPLWQLVDFTEDVSAADRSGLEAAMEGSGLLDAWVRPDGAVLDPEQRDVLLPLGPPSEAGSAQITMGAVLRPDAGESGTRGGVPAEVVRGVLARVVIVPAGAALMGRKEDSESPGAQDAVLALDGSWRLGPLTGRAAKKVAQYVGATARAAERVRRLAEVDDTIAEVDNVRADAAAREAEARSRRTELARWIAAVPLGVTLLGSWTLLDERTAAADRASQEASQAELVAAQARTEAAARRRTLDDLAARHDLPVTEDGLRLRRELLQDLDRRLKDHVAAAAPLQDSVSRWVQDWARWGAEAAHADQLSANAREQRGDARSAASEAEALRATLGADIEVLQRRLEEARADIAATSRRDKELQGELDALHGEVGAAGKGVDNARVREQEQEPVVVAAVGSLAALAAVPGLVRSALDRVADDSETVAFELARGFEAGHQPGARVPGKVVELGRRLAALPLSGRTVDANGLYASLRDAASSDAADHEPRVVVGPTDLLGALGRDDSGEHPVAALAQRLTAAVARDRELLTERERTLFEEHLIGELGEMLRQRRNEAQDLVAGMNRLLAGVTTSQGIAVRLQWQLRDDVPDEASRAVTLLGRTLGSLLPDERAELRDALHRLIDASRSEAPEDSYTEHLTRALDYRRWFAFRIRYTRPELAGKWHDLHRKSPLSQGEQKVVCYLPLFAAAAAHFTSLAGAAPYAPRFVLLDDAFPKIDVRTHPLLFGLLVAFDLDFVVTSERLWGDHATLPSLAIYEALRDPSERGIAQYHYTWDGARLQAVGT